MMTCSPRAKLLEQSHGFRARHGIEAVQRLIENQHRGSCAIDCASRIRCRMPLLYAGDLSVGCLGHGNALEYCGGFSAAALRSNHAVSVRTRRTRDL